MIWLALLGVGLALLAVALLLLPVRLTALAASDPARLRVELGLFAGLVRVALIDSARPRTMRAPAAKAATRARNEKKGSWRPSRTMVRAGLRAGLEALGKVRIERLSGEARVGLGDPARTGEFYGRAAALLAALPGCGFRLVPLFDREALEGEADLALSLVPARLLPVAARFVWALR